MNLYDFALGIFALALEIPFSVTSWIRTPKRNSSVGGHAESYHLCGLAVDVALDNPQDLEKLKKRARRFHLQVIDEGDHAHIEPA